MNAKNYLLTFVILLFAIIIGFAQQPQFNKLWETDTLLTTCESVLYNANQSVIYVSNIEGVPSQKDGKGSIAKVGLDGKIINPRWVSGLNAPKGLGMHGNTLWVANIDELVAIDMNSGQIKERIPVEGAKFLNDVTVTKSGVVYASDSDRKKVYRLKKGKITTYIDNLQRPNGLLALKKVLYVLDSGKLLQVNKKKQVTTIAEGMAASTDGVEQVKPGEFVVSSWAGVIYYVKSDGTTQPLLDTRDQKINTADIGYNAKERIVYIPTFYKNTVVAYQLK